MLPPVAELHQPVRTSRKFKLLEHEAFQLLNKYSIPHPPYGLARTPIEAVEIADSIGYPVAMKVVSPDISHKTDVGGVVLGVSGREDVVKNFELIIENVKLRAPSANIEGVLVQKMVPRGVEVIVGGVKDPIFGVVLMFGLGGVFTEVLKDVTFRIWPFTLEDAMEMISEIKSVELLQGYRGLPPARVELIADIILKLGKLLEENPEIESADLNPIMVYPDRALVVDARFILRKQA